MVYWYIFLKETLRGGLLQDSTGQGMVEYATILGMVLLACVGAVAFIGNDIQGLYDTINQGTSSSFETKPWFTG